MARKTLHLVADGAFEAPELGGRATPARFFTETYYDTATRRLDRAGFILRRRVENGKGIWQVTVTNSGPTPLQVEAAGGPSAPPEELQELLSAASAGFSLAPVARLRKRMSGLRVKEGRHSLARLEVTSVAVLDGSRVSRRFWEIDLEPLAGNRKQIGRIEKALRKAGAKTTDRQTRVAGGVEAGGPEELPAPTRALEQLRMFFREQYARILAHDPGVRLGGNPEDLHQLRVAARRLRSVLRTAAPLLESTWVDRMREELSWLGGELGPARDNDVLLAHLREEAAELDVADRRALKPLFDGLEQARQDGSRRALDALRSERYFGLLASLEGAAALPPAGARDVSLVSAARAELDRLARAMREFAKHPSDELAHRARIKGKRARYAAELVESDLGKAGGRLIACAKRFQDVAGEHQDAVVADERIRALTLGLRSQRGALAAGILVARQRERRDRAAAALPRSWAELEKAAARAWA